MTKAQQLAQIVGEKWDKEGLTEEDRSERLGRFHQQIVCTRNARMTLYCGKSHKSEFTCPTCGRKTWQNLSFLGQRRLVCDGKKFYKIDKWEIEA